MKLEFHNKIKILTLQTSRMLKYEYYFAFLWYYSSWHNNSKLDSALSG